MPKNNNQVTCLVQKRMLSNLFLCSRQCHKKLVSKKKKKKKKKNQNQIKKKKKTTTKK